MVPTKVDGDGDMHDILRRDLASPQGPGASMQSTGLPAGIAEAIEATLPRPVPCLVVTLMAKSAAEAARLLTKLPAQMDEHVGKFPVKLELRLDALPGFSERINAAALVLKLGVPVVLTHRTRSEGGVSTLTEPERQQFLLTLVSGLREPAPQGSLLDVEAAALASDPTGWSQVIAAAKERGFQLLLSHHDHEGSPGDPAHLLPPAGLLDGAPGGGALLWKSATNVRTWEQDCAILRALARGNRTVRRHAFMGMGSPLTRLLAPFFGCPLVYAAPDADSVAVPGQLPFADLGHVWSRWGITADDPALGREATTALLDPDAELAPRWALVGRPAWHSLSPAMHNAAARQLGMPHRYFPFEIPEHSGPGSPTDVLRDALELLRSVGVRAGNVTIPFKPDIIEVADRLEPEADALQAANTFWFEGDQLVVDNTDPIGIGRSFENAGVELEGQDALVLGAGGTARAALRALGSCASITVCNRTTKRADAIVEALGGHTDAVVRVMPWEQRHDAAKRAALIVHTTTIGMAGGPAPDDSPLSQRSLTPDHTILDAVYTPPTGQGFLTALLEAGIKAGSAVLDGSNLLLHQGAASFERWSGESPDLDAMTRGLRAASAIAMPSRVRTSYEQTGVHA